MAVIFSICGLTKPLSSEAYVFRTLSNIPDGDFLQEKLTAVNLLQFFAKMFFYGCFGRTVKQ